MKKFMCTMILLICLALICVAAFGQEEPTPVPVPEQPGTVVGAIEFTGNTALSAEVLRAEIGIQPGETVTTAQIADATRRIQSAYVRRGYIAEVTTYEVTGPETARTITFRVSETTIANVEVTGLERTEEQTIRRILTIRPGDVYNQRTVQQDINRINQLGIFEEIRVFERPAEQPGQVIVVMDFKEAKTRRVDLGGSLSPEGRLIGQVTYTDINFFGRAQQLLASVNLGTIAGQIGGQVLYYNPIVGRFGDTFTARAYSDVIFRFSRDLTEDPDIGRYFERHTGLQTVYNRRTGSTTRTAYGVRYDNTSVENLPAEFPPADAQLLMGSTRFSDDRRLFVVLPASGIYSELFAEAGLVDEEAGGSGGLAKARLDRRWYFPLARLTAEKLGAESPTPNRTLAVRFRAGSSAGDLPFSEQYFVGGLYDLRGYSEGRFWGKHFFALNSELRWPISRTLLGLAFVDVGDAWGSDFESTGVSDEFRQHRDFAPRAGAGVGLWYITDFGVVRLEYAKGEENRLHFAIGEAF